MLGRCMCTHWWALLRGGVPASRGDERDCEYASLRLVCATAGKEACRVIVGQCLLPSW